MHSISSALLYLVEVELQSNKSLYHTWTSQEAHSRRKQLHLLRPFDYTTILSLNFELWSATCSTSTKTWKRHTLGNRNEAIDFEILLASWALIYFWTLYELIYVTCLRFCGRLRWSVGCERALYLLQNVCTAYHLRSAILPKSNCDSHLSAESCSRTDSTGITFSRERKLSGQRAVLLAGDSFMQVYSDYH